MNPDYLLEQWADLLHRRGDGVGYSCTTTLGRVARGETFTGTFDSRPPPGVTDRCLRGFNLVEAVLAGMKDRARLVAAAEFGLVRPGGAALRSQIQRAEVLGLSTSQYRHALLEVRTCVREACRAQRLSAA